ncbi:MAG: efflux RND transporter permease subunit [Gammaproteobacteria bacterium]
MTSPAPHPDTVTRMACANFSGWFINHPVGTVLLTAALVLLGLIAFPFLPLASLPEVDLPTIQISASLPGASPETMASAVATPLEVQLTGVPGTREMTSSSSLGSTSITMQFDLNKNIDVAAQEVQAALNAAAGRLPADMPDAPTWKKGNPNDGPILGIGMRSELMTLTQLSDLAEISVARKLSQIGGVSEVNVYGQRKPALRIQASPEKLAALGLTFPDLRQVVRSSSVNQAKGAIYGRDRVSTLATNDQIFHPEEYGALIVAYRAGAPVLLRDVAKITLGAENDYIGSWLNGRPGVYLMVRRQPGASIVSTADAVRAALPAIREQLPASVDVEVLNDRTRTIRSSLHEVELTLLITFVLVILVMGVFLRQVSATAIVACVLAVALISTVAVMYVLGFSLNNLTLVALVIAVGFVVDDAIVVVENIHRHLETGASMRTAALEGASQIGFTVISMSLSLVAAFIPLLLMGGVVGRLFREFACTLTAATLFAVLASLSLAPMLASRFMKPLAHEPQTKPALAGRIVAAYDRGLRWSLAHQRTVLVLFGTTVAIAVASYVFVPKGFFPLQDTAFIVGASRAADDVAYEDMLQKHQQLAEVLKHEDAIEAEIHVVGANPNPNLANGRFYLVLKDRADRDVSAEELIDRLRVKLSHVPGINLVMRTQQDMNISSRGSRSQYQFVLSGADSAVLGEWSGRLTEKLQTLPQLRDVSNEMQMRAAVTRLTIDRVAAARFGFRAEDIDQVLYDAYGQRQIGEYQNEINQYRIILEADERQRGRIESLRYFHLRSPLTGQMVPLSAVARLEAPTAGPLTITHDGMFPSATLSFNLPAGVALGDALDLISRAQAEVGMPATLKAEFRGSAQAFQDSLATQPYLILAALAAVYIILGVLYESYVHPLTILSTLPSAGVGAILSLWALGEDFSIMALIGVVLLIGIVKKNGILLVDFALERQRAGMSPQEAIHEACLVRFRPIVMTTIAAMLGAIPLMLGYGTGAELRQPLGIAVFGGLVISQVLTLFTTPVIYLTLDRVFHRRKEAVDARVAWPCQ